MIKLYAVSRSAESAIVEMNGVYSLMMLDFKPQMGLSDKDLENAVKKYGYVRAEEGKEFPDQKSLLKFLSEEARSRKLTGVKS
ncbi:MAG TPA: hypothetical protein VMC07_00330 [Candidatus Omnitrophota bacterium]|nr:hypothetical protein [Candidatus Omnitrophota bacterium]